MIARLRTAAAALALLASTGCGTSNNTTPRPIEVLYYVSGGTGLQFTFEDQPNPEACGSNATGIQSANADHQFGDRVFLTPHLFVLENDRQPVRAAIRNTDLTQPITVDLYLGLNPQGPAVVINPGECRTIAQTGQFPPEPSPGPIRATPTAVTFPTPNARGPEVQVEICSPTTGLLTSCLDSTADRFIGFFASIGDIKATNLTNCLLQPILDACRSPATFFVEQPQDQIDAVISVNPGQNPGGQPVAEVRAELYINGQRVDSQAGTDPIVSANF